MLSVCMKVVLGSLLNVFRVVNVNLQIFVQKDNKLSTGVTKNKKGLTQRRLKVGVKFLILMFSEDHPDIKSLVLTFSKRLKKFTFSKKLKFIEKIQVFS